MDTATYLRTRVESAPFAAGLAVGDAVAILAFVTAGEFSHGNDPIGNPLVVPEAAAPFLIGWFLVAFVGGLFTREAVATPWRAVVWTVPAWVLAVLVGHAIRATEFVRGGTALSFILVTLAVAGALVVGWRVVAALVVDSP